MKEKNLNDVEFEVTQDELEAYSENEFNLMSGLKVLGAGLLGVLSIKGGISFAKDIKAKIEAKKQGQTEEKKSFWDRFKKSEKQEPTETVQNNVENRSN